MIYTIDNTFQMGVWSGIQNCKSYIVMKSKQFYEEQLIFVFWKPKLTYLVVNKWVNYLIIDL
jgi:hypothetical protein